MGLLSGPGEPIVVEPADGGGVRYVLRRPTVEDRVRYRRQVWACGGRTWTTLEMLDALADAIEVLLAHDQPGREAALAIVQEHRDRLLTLLADIRERRIPEWGPEFQERWRQATELPAAINELAEIATRRGDLRYAELRADLAVLPIAQGAAAVRVLLERVEQPDGTALPAREAADRIPEHHLVLIGRAIEEALVPTGEQLGNSPSPSG